MDEKASLSDKKIHMKSTEIHPVSEPKEQEDKKSAVLAANSVSGFRKQPGKKESSLDYKNTRQTRQEKKKSDQESRQESRKETYPRYSAGSEKNADFEDDGGRKRKEKPKENFVREKQKQKASKEDPKFHLANVSGPDIKRKDYDFGFKDTVTLTRTERGPEAVDQKSEDRFQSQQMSGEDRDTLKTRKKDEKISSKNEVRRGRVKKEQENTRMKKAIRRRMYAFMVNKLSGEEQKDSFAKAAKDIAVMRAGLVVKQLVLYLLGLLGPLLGGLVTIALPFVLIIVILYNTPLALFLPPLQEGDTVQSVLSEYYREFNEEVRAAEEDSDEDVTYKNMQNGVARSNFTDVMMVYMVRYGTGQGNFSTVMSDKNKKHLKEIFDEMNHFASETVTDTIRAGESLGIMTFSGYCNCSICCGQWSGGPTASGVMPKADHTLAVDAYNPTLPMGTHIIAGGKEYVVEDTGDFDRYGVDFDMYFGDHGTAQNFGHQDMEVFLADSNGSNTVEVTHTSLYVYNLTYEDYIELGKLTPSQEKLLREVMSDEFLHSMPASGIGEQVALAALDKVGCQYSQDLRYEEGYYDCSSLVQRLYAEFGINLPSVASTQGQYIVDNGLQVSENELRPGDLIFHSRDTNAGEFMSIGHVAIYVGNGMQVDARGTAYGVVYRPLVPSNIGLYGRPCR
ncbi:C40 family peptidase [Blautia marasmi]|uniref:C40 family peptidase n=1 Tax=Blautia marasmi TaxID=1917868 RepID=UPI001FA92B9B|nr:NlpC/P60 family protein [Blautia marasmi]